MIPQRTQKYVAIREACRNLGDFKLTSCDLYTTSSPARCASAPFTGRGRRGYFSPASAADAAAVGFDDAFIYEEFGPRPRRRRLPMQQLLREESLAIFTLWRQQEKKIPY